MSEQATREKQFRRHMLRSDYQSLFWHALLVRKRETKFTLKALADKLGINKSYVTRSFSSPPNWTIDKISDMADALELDLVVEARDRATGRLYTPTGNAAAPLIETHAHAILGPETGPSTGSDFSIAQDIQIRESA